ncbi:MAG TPA: MBL fold metallo-hydrolase [Phycisphaerae bacterium]|jgi:glyoxylase-like metal-dependent hydrolase (beta-lactamase superfamily II)
MSNPEFSLSTRREFFRRTSCLGAAALLGANALPRWALGFQEDAPPGKVVHKGNGFRVLELRPHVYMVVTDLAAGTRLVANGGFVVGGDAVLLIDVYRTLDGTRAVHEAVRSVTKLPIRGVVLTHFHFDHVGGAALYAGQEIPLIAHPVARQRLAQRYGLDWPAQRDTRRAALEKALSDAPDEEHRRRAQSNLDLFTLADQTVGQIALCLPEAIVDLKTLPSTLDLGGGVRVQIDALPGHTGGDLIVQLPEREVVFTGDLLWNRFFPYSADATLHEWIHSVRKLAYLEPRTVYAVGHGEPCGIGGPRRLLRLWSALHDQIRASYDQSIPLAEARERLSKPEEFQNDLVLADEPCFRQLVDLFYSEFAAGHAPEEYRTG